MCAIVDPSRLLPASAAHADHRAMTTMIAVLAIWGAVDFLIVAGLVVVRPRGSVPAPTEDALGGGAEPVRILRSVPGRSDRGLIPGGIGETSVPVTDHWPWPTTNR
ncbi:hypothetical protein AB0L40_21490 [Patulibacter sp. NPDC049589]|uniref:hypothetical protein n=1 Tax=Patulibacter sp. NPDC049589 TaxID=3154731 RepID=UPI00342AD34D